MRYGTKISEAVLYLLLLAAPTAFAAEDDIKQAVERGVTLLKGLQKDNGVWP